MRPVITLDYTEKQGIVAMSQPTSPICPRCQPCGPALLPVRYAAIPTTVSPKLAAWATPQEPFPETEEYTYGLRAMRAGFLYVYYEGNKSWAAWSITPDGGLWKQDDAPSAQPKYSSNCSRGIHKATNIEFIVLDSIALTSNVWLAFSPYKWNPALFDLYGSTPDIRKKRMQSVEPWHWTGPEEEYGIAQATEENLKTVLDYLPTGPGCPEATLPFVTNISRVTLINQSSPYYDFARSSIRPRLTLYPWSTKRAGASKLTVKSLQTRGTKPDGTPIKPLIMAINDPIGISHELTSWCDDMTLVHQTYRDELSLEFATYFNKKGLEDMVKQSAGMQFDQQHGEKNKQLQIQMQMNTYLPDLYRDPQGKNKPSPEKIGKHYDEVMAKYKKTAMNDAWKKYEEQFDTIRIKDLIDTYTIFCDLLESKLDILIGFRLKWLRHDLFIQCIEDFKSSATYDNLNYRDLVSYALASINLSETGTKQIESWIKEYSVDNNKNLFWRSQVLNNPEIMANIKPVLDEMKKQSKSESPTVGKAALSVFTGFISYLGPLADACDRALNALDKDTKNGREISFSRRVFGAMDNILTTTTNLVLSKTVLGNRIDSLNGMLFKKILSLHAGVPQSQITALLVADVNNNGILPSKLAEEIQQDADKNIIKQKAKLAQLQKEMESFVKTEDGMKKIKVTRVKFLGLAFYSAQTIYFYNKSQGSFRDITEWSSTAFFAASSISGIIQFAYENIAINNSMISATKFMGSATGSIASGLSVIVDFIDLIDTINKDGARWKSTGVKTAKLFSDTAFAIQTTNDVLEFFGKKSIESLFFKTVEKGTGFVITRIVGVMASWQVMVIITMTPWLINLFFNNDLQNWCKSSALGNKPKVSNTSLMNQEKIIELINAQEIKLNIAMHYTYDTILSKEAQKSEKEKWDTIYQKIGEQYKNGPLL